MIVNFNEMVVQSLKQSNPDLVTAYNYGGQNSITDSINPVENDTKLNDGTGRRYFLWGLSSWEEDSFDLTSDIVNE